MLRLGGDVIQCFATPTYATARRNARDFYGWVINGQRLYRALERHYPLFDRRRIRGRKSFETFPHAIMCYLAGEIVPAKPKRPTRREALRARGVEVDRLTNLDFLDAGLCALAAQAFLDGRYERFRDDPREGSIVVPAEYYDPRE